MNDYIIFKENGMEQLCPILSNYWISSSLESKKNINFQDPYIMFHLLPPTAILMKLQE
jgi:hypothetical protein